MTTEADTEVIGRPWDAEDCGQYSKPGERHTRVLPQNSRRNSQATPPCQTSPLPSEIRCVVSEPPSLVICYMLV